MGNPKGGRAAVSSVTDEKKDTVNKAGLGTGGTLSHCLHCLGPRVWDVANGSALSGQHLGRKGRASVMVPEAGWAARELAWAPAAARVPAGVTEG